MNEVRRFLRTVFEGKPDDAFLLIWTLPSKHSLWFQKVERAARHVINNLTDADTYCGVGLSSTDRGAKRRLTNDDCAGLVGFIADIDYASEDKDGYAHDREAAEGIIERCGLRPSLVVSSGHGLQAWWLFKEAWMFADHDERQAAYQLSADWQASLKEHARALGFRLDSVFDLARVFRVAGTTNNKRPPPVPVELLWYDGPQYVDDDFRDRIVSTADLATAMNGPTFIDPQANFPVAKHEALLAACPEYAQSWRHERRDLSDTSLSGYDLSLVNLAARANWTDDELASLIRYHRERHGDPQGKGTSADYLRRTIGKATASLRQERAHEEAVNTVASPDEASPPEVVRALGASFNIPLQHVQRIAGKTPMLRFHLLVNGEREIGRAHV